jgi:hypothetical protein
MLRVVLGRARPDTEWSGKISGIQFNPAPGVQRSPRSRGAASTILTVLRSHREEEADLEVNEERPLDVEEGRDVQNEVKERISYA